MDGTKGPLELQTIPGFAVVETLHDSGAVKVFRAVRAEDSETVIIKTAWTAESAALLRHEYTLCRRIDHDGVLKPLEIRQLGGVVTMVSADTGGQAIARRVLDGPLPVAEALSIARDVADVLIHVHAAGLVHKDINPANIVSQGPGAKPVLIDFGIATDLQQEEAEVEPGGSVEGTLAYVAPEQTGRTNRLVDHRSDLYGLGATLHTLLTGAPPFPATDPLELVHSHIARRPVPVHRLNPAVPGAVSEIIARLMAKDPEQRYQSAFGLRADLDRCVDEITRMGAVAPFPLGTADIRAVLRIPQKLYGREAELVTLTGELRKASLGQNALVLVGGWSGVGKSALIRELNGPTVAADGFFVGGKFEQLRGDVPFAPFLSALRQLIRQVSPRRDRVLITEAIRRALGSNLQVIADLVPELAALTGPGAPVPVLGPAEAQNRLMDAMRLLFGAIAGAGRPIALFLDDMQWADLASLQVLEALARPPGVAGLLLIAAFRANELAENHGFTATLEVLHRAGVRPVRLDLDALPVPAVVALLADTLQAAPETVGRLAACVQARTLGNPFLIGQMLESLRRRNLIRFDAVAGAWQWDEGGIDDSQAADAVADFLVARIRDLPDGSVTALQVAACIGSQFDLQTLALAGGWTRQEAAAILRPALESRLIMPVGRGYRYVEHADSGDAAAYRFLHDRVEQATYSLLPEDDRPARHLAVARALEDKARQADHNTDTDRELDLVHHLNRARTLLSVEQRWGLVLLNRKAGLRARASAAYGPALGFLQNAIALLTPDAWERDLATVLDLHAVAAELAVYVGQDDVCEEYAAEVMRRARNPVDAVAVQVTLMHLHNSRGRVDKAIAIMNAALDALDVGMPAQVDMAAVGGELVALRAMLEPWSADRLVDLPETTDPRMLAVGAVYGRMNAVLFVVDHLRWMLFMLRVVRMSVEQGCQKATCIAWASYGVALLVAFKDYDGSIGYGRVAERLAERLGAAETRGTISFLMANMMDMWHRPVARSLEALQEAFRIGLEHGDHEYGSYCLGTSSALLLCSGLPLTEAEQQIARNADALERLNQAAAIQTTRVARQVALNLLGDAERPWICAGPLVDEDKDIPEFVRSGHLYSVALFFAESLQLRLMFGRADDAWRQARAGQALYTTFGGTLRALRTEAMVAIAGLTMGKRLPRADLQAVKAGARVVIDALQATAGLQLDCFAHLTPWVEAELARAKGRPTKALRLYRQAADLAKGQPQDEGMIAERAADLALETSDRVTSFGWMCRARAAFVRWQARAKVRQVDGRLFQEFSDLLPEQSPAGSAMRDTGDLRTLRPGSSGGDTVDAVALAKTVQAIARDIRLDDLLHNLLRTVVASAGATRGALLLVQDDGLTVAAEQTEDGSAVRRPDRRYGADDPWIPASPVLQVVAEMRSVAIEDAGRMPELRGHPRVAMAKQLSILALPLMNRSRLVGLLYLENDLATGAFSPKRLEMLELLTGQMAMSLENALLFDGLERLNRTLERQVEARTLELADKSAMLGAALTGMGEGLALFDRDGKLRLCNQSLGRMLDLPTRATNLPDRADLATALARASGKASASGEALLVEAQELELSEGRSIQVRRSAMPDGGQVVVFVDTTEIRSAQAILARQERLASLGRLVAGVAHEMNTPLGILLSAGSQLTDEVRDLRQAVDARKLGATRLVAFTGDAEELAGLVVRNAKRVATLVSAFKSLSVDASQDIPDSIRLAACLEEVVAVLSTSLLEAQVQVSIAVADDPVLTTRIGMLEQVLVELIENAVGHAFDSVAEDRRIWLEARRETAGDGNRIRISVSDNGGGLSEEARNHAFDPFFTTGRSRGHAGLGLHTAHNIVATALHGRLWIEPTQAGTCFMLSLPDLTEEPDRD